MSWKECDSVSERREFVQLASVPGANISRLCERFNVSRKTGYKWLKRFREAGQAGLRDRSRKPKNSPWRTPAEIEQAVLNVRGKHPHWGPFKIRRLLQNQGMGPVPAASTITSILHRNGCITAEESSKHKPLGHFQRATANELWQVDFKGEFKLTGDQWCYPLTLLDDHSRFSLGIFACGNQRRLTVQEYFRRVFDRYGMPHSVYVDNGNPWGTTHTGVRHTQFTVWLLRHNIEVIHGTPYHPEGRGKLERFHRTFQQELLQDRQFTSMIEAQRQFDPWRQMYNTERPHQALDFDVPASRYEVSPRRFCDQPEDYDYSERFTVRKVNRGGIISLGGKKYWISAAFRGEHVGLSPGEKDGVWDVYYRRFKVGVMDQRQREVGNAHPRG